MSSEPRVFNFNCPKTTQARENIDILNGNDEVDKTERAKRQQAQGEGKAKTSASDVGAKCALTKGESKCSAQLMDLKPVDDEKRREPEGNDGGDKAKEDQQLKDQRGPTGEQRPRQELAGVAEQEQQQPCSENIGAAQASQGDSTPPSQLLSSHLGRLQMSPPGLARRLRRQAARLRHSLALTHRRLERRRSLQHIEQSDRRARHNSSVTGDTDSRNITSSQSPTQTTRAISNSAVRVLFREHLHQTTGATGSTVRSHSGTAVRDDGGNDSFVCHSDPIGARTVRSNLDPGGAQHLRNVAVVEASRRLVEHQIEAIRNADSRRWNFDFGLCRPMNQRDHRYYAYQTQSRERPLSPFDMGTNEVDDNDNGINSSGETVRDNQDTNINSINDNSNNNELQQVTSMTPGVQLRNPKPLSDQNQNNQFP